MMIHENKKEMLIRPARPSDIDIIAANMRPEDVREIWASNRVKPKRALEIGLMVSDYVMTMESNGQPFAMWGVVKNQQMPYAACIWLLGTPEIEKVWLYFGRTSKKVIRKLLEEYEILYNHVDVRNQKSITWLKWCGAKFDDPSPHGPDNMPFQYFVFRRP